MKKLVISLSAFALILSSTPITAYASDNNDIFEIRNNEAKEKMNFYLGKKEKSRSANTTDKLELIISEVEVKNASDFSKLIAVADGNNDLEYLYTYEDENVTDVIAYDTTDSSYILLESDLVNNISTLTVDQDTYAIVQKGDKLSLESANGNQLIFYEEVFDENTGSPILPADGQEVKNVDVDEYAIQPYAAGSWKTLGGPFHKTSKMAFEVLELIGQVAGAITLVVTSTALGVALFIYSAAVSVGQTIKPTIHIKYYQYGAKDCLSYIKERRYYYGAYSEVSGTYFEPIKTKGGALKITEHFFHSQRPDYTGNPACLRY